ncbi:MAG: GNAT family N-acetyltransferase [Nocardioidaceae bacterium]
MPILATLRRVWTEEQAGSAADDNSFEAEFAAWHARENDHRVTWLAEVEVGPVGMLNVLIFFTRMPRPRRVGAATMPTQWGYIANMFVLERYRNSGIGARAAVRRHRLRRPNRLSEVGAEPSQLSVPFYERPDLSSRPH